MVLEKRKRRTGDSGIGVSSASERHTMGQGGAMLSCLANTSDLARNKATSCATGPAIDRIGSPFDRKPRHCPPRTARTENDPDFAYMSS